MADQRLEAAPDIEHPVAEFHLVGEVARGTPRAVVIVGVSESGVDHAATRDDGLGVGERIGHRDVDQARRIGEIADVRIGDVVVCGAGVTEEAPEREVVGPVMQRNILREIDLARGRRQRTVTVGNAISPEEIARGNRCSGIGISERPGVRAAVAHRIVAVGLQERRLGRRQIGNVVPAGEQSEGVAIARKVRTPIESPTLAEVHLEVDAGSAASGRRAVCDLRMEGSGGSQERHRIERGRLRRGNRAPVIAARELVPVPRQGDVAVELVLVVDRLEVKLDLAGGELPLEVAAQLIAPGGKARIQRPMVIAIKA